MVDVHLEAPLGSFRIEAAYTASRLSADPDVRVLAIDFKDAESKFALLEQEATQLAAREGAMQGLVESADDAWDDEIRAFHDGLLTASDGSVDHPRYRSYFADVPSGVTHLSYAAELLVSRELEKRLSEEPLERLRSFEASLRAKREVLEKALHEQTVLEVTRARFENRAALGKSLLNRLRAETLASLQATASAKNYGPDWCYRFFRGIGQLGHQTVIDPSPRRRSPGDTERPELLVD
jgi:hypothetical protein